MAYDVSQIIPITARIVPNGIATANFAEALMFAPQTELPVGFSPDTYRTYTSLTALQAANWEPRAQVTVRVLYETTDLSTINAILTTSIVVENEAGDVLETVPTV